MQGYGNPLSKHKYQACDWGPFVFSRPGFTYSVPRNAGAPPDPHICPESRELFFSLNFLQTYLARERDGEKEVQGMLREGSAGKKESGGGWGGGVGTHLKKTWGDPRILAYGGASGCQVLHFP